MHVTTLRTFIVNIFISMPLCLVAAGSSNGVSIYDTSVQNLGPKSLQELTCRAIGQAQQFHIYSPWMPLDHEQTSCAIMDELQHTITVDDTTTHEQETAKLKNQVHDAVTFVTEDIAYLRGQYSNDIDRTLRTMQYHLKMMLIDDFARSMLLREFEKLVQMLEYWPDADRLSVIRSKLINGLDGRRLTYIPTKKSYEKEFDGRIKKAKTKSRQEFKETLSLLVQRYNDLDDLNLPVTLPLEWSTEAVSDDITIMPTSDQEQEIRTLAYNQCYHIYPVNSCIVNDTKTVKTILALLGQGDDISPTWRLWIKDGVWQSKSDHSMLRDWDSLSFQQNRIDALETMLAAQDFSFETLDKIIKAYTDLSERIEQLPKPEELIKSCDRIIRNLDSSRSTFEREQHIYTAWRDEKIAIIRELKRRYMLIDKQYNDLEIRKKHSDIIQARERRADQYRRDQRCGYR